MNDNVTSIIKRSIDFIFLRNPLGTSMGVLFGIILYWLVMLFTPFLNSYKNINIQAIRIEFLIPLGIFLFNMKFFFGGDDKLDLEVERRLAQVRKSERNKLITKAEARLQYTNIIRKYVESYSKEESKKQTEAN